VAAALLIFLKGKQWILAGKEGKSRKQEKQKPM